MIARRLCFWGISMLAVLLTLAGCASGGLSLTDGNIPIGDVDGVVFLTTRAVANSIPVELVKPSGQVFATVRTNESGAFAFHGVPQGRWRVRARIDTRTGAVDFDLAPADTVLIVLQVVEINTSVQDLHLTPSGALQFNIGDQVTFAADGHDLDGNPIANVPVSWAVQGHIGTITADGRFLAERAGSGLVVAQYNELQAAVQVIVNPQDGPGPGGA